MVSTLRAKEREEVKRLGQRANRDPFTSLRDEMNDLVSKLWNGHEAPLMDLSMNPAVDLCEDDNSFEVHMDAPGLAAEDFDIEVQGNLISIKGKRSDKKQDKSKTYHRIERCSGSFVRTLTLPCEIVEDEVVAQYDNGVLTLTLPKCEASKRRKINVRS